MMQQKPQAADAFFTQFQNTMKDMMAGGSAFPVDVKTMMEMQRKNMQAMAELNQRTVQGWQALAQRQAEMVSDFLQDNSTLARESFTEGTPEQKMARQTEMFKKAYQRTLANSQELTQIVTSCTKEAGELINKRVLATLNEIKASGTKDKA